MNIRGLFKTGNLFWSSIFVFLALATTCVAAGDSGALDSMYTDEINMLKGELVTLKAYSLTRVSVADPDIADIADANDQEVLLIGKRKGETALFIWDENGKRTITVYVYAQNLELLEERAKRLFKDADIQGVKVTASDKEGKIIVPGSVPQEKQRLYDDIVLMFPESIVSLIKEDVVEDLVQIDMQITEMSTSVTKSLGIDWFTGTQSGAGDTMTVTASKDFLPTYGERFPNLDAGIEDFFRFGQFQRTSESAFIARISALVTEGKARLLSKPKLVVISGEEARFLVGGEIPIRTTTISDSGGSQENVEFKQYGISMTITPTIKKEKIDIVMNVEVSEIDAATASTISDEIAFSTRSASTHLYLDNGQLIVLAGMIKEMENELTRRIPFLSNIPVLGLLFRSKANPVPQTDLELVIALTPRILRQKETIAAGSASADADKDISLRVKGGRQPYQNVAPYYLGIPREMTGYVHDVQQKISQAIAYPSEARQYGWEGTVKVGMLILNDGTLAFALVKESSGHDIFDEVALNTTKKLAPFAAFPSDTNLQELNVTIPIVYSLKKN